MTKIGVMGHGMVGGSLANYFEKNRGYQKGQNLFCYDPGKAMRDLVSLNKADIVFVCVPTPYNTDPLTGKLGFDLSYVRSAIGSLEGSKIVVIKSTVRPGTTEMLQREFPRHRLLFNPEFLTEITADQDMNYPDRQLIGYTDQSYTVAGDVMQLLPLAPWERVMRAREAEMVKYFGNTWFAAKVVFANQMYDFCQAMDIDYDTVKESASADKRIGRTHLEVIHKGYRGYGGKCLPKDTRALIEHGEELGVSLDLLKAAEAINNGLMTKQGVHPHQADKAETLAVQPEKHERVPQPG